MHKIIAANWKMHKTRAEAAQTAKDLVAALAQKNIKNREVLVFPPFTAIADVAAVFGGKEGLAVGGQNCYPAEEGAYTGEISPKMLRDAGASWVLTGHSERRHILGESDRFCRQQNGVCSGSWVQGHALHRRNAGRARCRPSARSACSSAQFSRQRACSRSVARAFCRCV